MHTERVCTPCTLKGFACHAHGKVAQRTRHSVGHSWGWTGGGAASSQSRACGAGSNTAAHLVALARLAPTGTLPATMPIAARGMSRGRRRKAWLRRWALLTCCLRPCTHSQHLVAVLAATHAMLLAWQQDYATELHCGHAICALGAEEIARRACRGHAQLGLGLGVGHNLESGTC
jgi:hypothetical protein